jgi:tRNA-modifying protein YgfZ
MSERYTGATFERVIEVSDYELVRDSVGLIDRSERGKLRLLGVDVVDFLQGQVTNDIEALEPGTGCYAALLDHKGKVRTDMRVLRGADWIWLDTEPGFQDLLARTVQMYGIGRDVKAEDATADHAILSLVGPGAGSVLDAAPPEREHSFVEGEHGLYVSTDVGVDVICSADQAPAVREALRVAELPPDVAECVRIEAGRPRFGVDFESGTIPEEAGLNDRAVSFTKGCYVGQETVARLHYKGKPNRHLRGLRLSGDAEAGAELRLGEKTVGILGSVAVSPVHGPIALALVRREAEPGAVVEVGASGTTAEVVDLPFAS